MTQPKSKSIDYLDLDAVVPDVDIGFTFKGMRHKLVPVSVDDFVRNIEALQKLDVAGEDLAATIAILKDMLKRAFPSLSDDVLSQMNLLHLNRLMEFANENSGTRQVNEEAAAEQGKDPPKAG